MVTGQRGSQTDAQEEKCLKRWGKKMICAEIHMRSLKLKDPFHKKSIIFTFKLLMRYLLLLPH